MVFLFFLNFPEGSPGCRFCQTWPFYITSKKNFNSVTLRQSSLTSASIIHWRISDILLEFLLVKQANSTTSRQKNRGLMMQRSLINHIVLGTLEKYLWAVFLRNNCPKIKLFLEIIKDCLETIDGTATLKLLLVVYNSFELEKYV